MKAPAMTLLLVAGLQAAPAHAQSRPASPLIGHWVLQPDSLPIPVDLRPARVDLTFRDAGAGKWTTRVEIVDKAGKQLHSESTLALDGTPGRASGTYFVDVTSARMPEPGVLVMQFGWQGKPASTRVYTVSADGSTLTETETFFKPDGTPGMRPAVFKRADASR